MARLYSNENFYRAVCEHLRELGHDVPTSMDAGNANQSIPDEEVLAFAARENRVLITLNRKDFIKLHRKTPEHAGIIVCTHDRDLLALADQIHQAILHENGELAKKLIRVNRTNA